MLTEPIDGWWESPALAFAEGARVAYLEGIRDALDVAEGLYGVWRFDADALVRTLQARGQWPLTGPARGERYPRAGTSHLERP